MPVFLETKRELVFEPVSHHLDLDLFQDQIQASLAPVELTQPTCQLQAVRTSGHQPTRPNRCQP